MFIDPPYASRLLATNPENQRAISGANLQKLENSFRAEKMFLTGQAIIIDEEGNLLDGQHRLQAAVNTNLGFWTVLVAGIPREYFKYMDNGKSRSFRDVLKTRGHASNAVLSATIQRLAEYIKDPRSVGTSTVFAHSELSDVLDMSPGLDAAVRATAIARAMLPNSQTAWLYYLGHAMDSDSTESFFSKLANGEMLARTDPVFHLRLRIINARASGYHPPMREMMALLIKTWNAFLAGTSVKLLQWKPEQNEDFPILVLPERKKIAAHG